MNVNPKFFESERCMAVFRMVALPVVKSTDYRLMATGHSKAFGRRPAIVERTFNVPTFPWFLSIDYQRFMFAI